MQKRSLGLLVANAALVFAGFAPLGVVHAANYTILHSFDNGPNGAEPLGLLSFDSARNGYGTTVFGGDVSCQCGTIFRIRPTGKFKLLYTFTGGVDGGNPGWGVILDPSTGDLYGAADDGGTKGAGTIFKLTVGGVLETLHTFDGNTEGTPSSAIVRDAAGNIYGTTVGGPMPNGTVYKLTPDGTFSILHIFDDPNDVFAKSRLLRDKAGNLYGVTYGGGPDGYGTVYKVTPGGTYTVLHAFAPGSSSYEGCSPAGGLARDKAGNLYGTAANCGGERYGTVFKLAPDGTFAVIYNFVGHDGAHPYGDLLLIGQDLYGSTSEGGDFNCPNDFNGCGIVFKMYPEGAIYRLIQLHTFSGSPNDGYLTDAGVTAGPRHLLYGTVGLGGPNGGGIIYSLPKS